MRTNGPVCLQQGKQPRLFSNTAILPSLSYSSDSTSWTTSEGPGSNKKPLPKQNEAKGKKKPTNKKTKSQAAPYSSCVAVMGKYLLGDSFQ